MLPPCGIASRAFGQMADFDQMAQTLGRPDRRTASSSRSRSSMCVMSMSSLPISSFSSYPTIPQKAKSAGTICLLPHLGLQFAKGAFLENAPESLLSIAQRCVWSGQLHVAGTCLVPPVIEQQRDHNQVNQSPNGDQQMSLSVVPLSRGDACLELPTIIGEHWVNGGSEGIRLQPVRNRFGGAWILCSSCLYLRNTARHALQVIADAAGLLCIIGYFRAKLPECRRQFPPACWYISRSRGLPVIRQPPWPEHACLSSSRTRPAA
jgi:hypothetical protein